MVLVIKSEGQNFKLTVPFYEELTGEEKASFAMKIEEIYQNYFDSSSNAVWMKYQRDNNEGIKYSLTLEGEIICHIDLPDEDDLDMMCEEICEIYFLFSAKQVVDSFYDN